MSDSDAESSELETEGQQRMKTTTFQFDGLEIYIDHRDMGSESDDEGVEDGDYPKDDDEEEEECYVDPCFFDEGYTVAAMTGFTRVWEASEVLTRIMEGTGTDDNENDNNTILRDRIRGGARVVELGSGVGLVGICAAALGGHVMLTDLHSIVDGVLKGNVARNSDDDNCSEGDGKLKSGMKANREEGPWPCSRKIGRGTATTRYLDWTKSVECQVQSDPGAGDPRLADLILIADCTWLRSLLEPCVTTSVSLMKGPHRPSCVVAHRERDGAAGGHFLAAAELVEAFEKEGCRSEVLRKIPSRDEEGRQILIYEFSLNG